MGVKYRKIENLLKLFVILVMQLAHSVQGFRSISYIRGVIFDLKQLKLVIRLHVIVLS